MFVYTLYHLMNGLTRPMEDLIRGHRIMTSDKLFNLDLNKYL